MTPADRPWACIAAIAAFIVPTAGLHAGGQAHEHGVTHLEVVADGTTLAINLRGAGHHLVGFEHAPEDDEQSAAWNDTRDRLADAATLFAPSAAARCTIEHARVAAPDAGDEADARTASGDEHHDRGHAAGETGHGIDPAAAGDSGDHGHDHGHRHEHHEHHGDHHHDHDDSGAGHGHDHGDHDHGGHASDWTASYRFTCDAPARLEYIDIALFDAFPAHVEVRYQRLSDSGQSGGTLSAGDNRLRMR